MGSLFSSRLSSRARWMLEESLCCSLLQLIGPQYGPSLSPSPQAAVEVLNSHLSGTHSETGAALAPVDSSRSGRPGIVCLLQHGEDLWGPALGISSPSRVHISSLDLAVPLSLEIRLAHGRRLLSMTHSISCSQSCPQPRLSVPALPWHLREDWGPHSARSGLPRIQESQQRKI
jgi:hypothetical protein